MAKRGFDVVLVRRSGPVTSFSMRGGWIYLLAILLLVLTAAVSGGGYLVWQQQKLVTEMAEETRMLSLRAERLEALSQEQETREILAQQATEERPHSPEKGRKASPPPSPPASSPAAADASPAASGGESIRAAETAASDEPSKSAYITISNIEQKEEGGDLVVTFDLINEREGKEPVSGYISLVAHGKRNGKAWIEAWPPQRLTPQGRPQSFRRGTPFSVQRYRHVRARVAAITDKQFETVEFVIHSRQGELALVHAEPVELDPAASKRHR